MTRIRRPYQGSLRKDAVVLRRSPSGTSVEESWTVLYLPSSLESSAAQSGSHLPHVITELLDWLVQIEIYYEYKIHTSFQRPNK